MIKAIKTQSFKGESLLRFSILFFMIFGIFLLSACHDDDDNDQSSESSLMEILESMGGNDVVVDTENMSYKVNGSFFEFEEEEPNQSNPINARDYCYILKTRIGERQVRKDYVDIKSKFPLEFSTSVNPIIIINDKKGTRSGQYDVATYFFGQVQPTPLYANRIEADLKNYAMSNPVELIRNYLKINSDLTTTTQNNELHIPTGIENLDIVLKIDLETHLPTKATIQESDFLHGDVMFEVNYRDWIGFGELKFPTKLDHVYNDFRIRTETVSEIETNSILDPSTFITEAVSQEIEFDEGLAQKGIYHSQWYSRFFDLSLPIDMPLTIGFVAADQWAQFGIGDQTIADHVKIIGRPDLQYWSVAIKTNDGVLLVDAPVSPEWCRSIINAVQDPNGFPGEEVIGVIPTHTHVDHFGGIREMAAVVQKVYINETATADLESILSANHTLVPDALSMNSSSPSIVPVSGITILEEGNIEIHAVQMNEGGDNPHSENMLIVYIPEQELIIQADLFNAGALLAVYAGQGAFPMSESTKAIWKERAGFLLEYIEEKELTVSKLVGIHGGLASFAQLQFVANQ